MAESKPNMPREPADTQEWIRETFGDRPHMTDAERMDAKDAQRERKLERQYMHSGEGRRRWRVGRYQGRD